MTLAKLWKPPLQLAAALIFAFASPASADCGDDVDGRRVPCSCGDIVVSDTTLQPADPVVKDRCEGNGLVIRARRGEESIVLDLGGAGLIGRGNGTGIVVLDGGEQGAEILGAAPDKFAEIAGFRTGIRAGGRRSVKAIRNVIVKANERDGLVLRTDGVVLENVITSSNGRQNLRTSDSAGQEVAR